MPHNHDLEAMERTAASWCDDARAHRLSDLSAQIREELQEAHKKTDMTKMVIRQILRGSNNTMSWTKCEAALTRLVDMALKFGGL